MNAPSRIFRSPEGHELPLIGGTEGFTVYAALLSKQLGYRETKDMVRILDEDEKMLVTGGGKNSGASEQAVWYVTEPGFYRVVGQRNVNVIKDPTVREAVYRFQRWVFHEVVPAMVRAGIATGMEPRYVWSWDEIAAQVKQRYGPDFLPSEITMGLRAAGWLKSGSATPKAKYRNYFWHTGTAFMVYPHVLPELAADLIRTMQALGDARVQQYQLSFFPALTALEGGGES